ncbi:MAG: glycosyltransferase [Peptococcaceae bacterium]|jgi:glycosyltransferase involved in cell wall biosynthesis|nr:glycosyltransferase [Peptococcaceae bacterium]
MGNRISLCMIVRDEEANLRRCLDSAAACVDEIVVVDTGSADETVAIAQSFGARVWHFPWRDDFSLARNRSLAEAGGDWVLVLDADEELPGSAASRVRELAAAGEAWTFTVVSPPGPEGGELRQPALRLFRNREDYRFEGRVYEQIQPGAVIRHATLPIRHHGYTGGRRDDGKTRRNIRLLQAALLSNPFEPFLNYNMGVNRLASGEPATARGHFEIALLAVDGRSAFSPALYLYYARCLYELGDFAHCAKLLEEGLGHFPAYPDLHFWKGRLYDELGLLEQARSSYSTCTGFRHVLPEYTTVEGVTGHLSREKLAGIAWREGDPDAAAGYLAAACKNQNPPPLMRRLGRVLQQKGLSGTDLYQALSERLDVDRATMARLLFDLGEYEACLALTGDDQARYAMLRAGCLNRTGRPADALALLESCVEPEASAREKRLASWLLDPDPDAGAEIAGLIGEAALAAWGSGDQAKALELGGAVYGDKARLALAGRALAAGTPAVACDLLAGEPGTESTFLKGRACARLGRHQEALAHFLGAAAERESGYAAALEQALNHCRDLVLNLLKVEEQNSGLQLELFRLASRQKKLGGYKGE